MATERVLSNLNLISFKTESGFQNHIDELQDGDLVFTPDNSLKGTLLDFKWADHLLNDMSWLRADTFSWHSGDVYVAAYNHLVADFEGAELKRYYAWVSDSGYIYYSDIENVTNGRVAYMYNNGKFTFDPYIYFNVSDGAVSVGTVNVTRDASKDKDSIVNSNEDTFGDITITYYRAEDGHKICLPDQEDKLFALYNATGVAWYYMLDAENKRFKLPRSKHNKYADTVPVVGNGKSIGLTDGEKEYTGGFDTYQGVGITSILANDEQVVLPSTVSDITSYGSITKKAWGVTTDSTKSGIIAQQAQDADQYKYLYFYVGNFERDAVEQTAGITTEMFNSKADSDLGNVPANYDYVVESQMPTAENGYTWYRKYKSGWVEQGGRIANNSTSTTVTLPVVMTDANYTLVGGLLNGTASASYEHMNFNNLTPTSFVFTSYDNYGVNWQVSGMAAQ